MFSGRLCCRRSGRRGGPTLLLALGMLLSAAGIRSQPLTLHTVASGFDRPVGATHAGDGSGRLFVPTQTGQIFIFDGIEVLPAPFLDISSLLACCGNRGLLGLAFHPDYATNGFFYVNYTDTDGGVTVARYTVSAVEANEADASSALIVLGPVSHPERSHNGNHLAFGPDGYLYIAMGDGVTPDDRGRNGQDLGVLLGKILRIDVDQTDPGLSYAIPPGNPFVGDPAARDEIWAYGLRNPWRFSFDRLTGDLFIGDVGELRSEEIDFQPATSGGGENYGWRRMEGSLCFNPPTDCNDGSLTLPILEYFHASSPGACSVTGGYRYRGSRTPQLEGVYIFADFCSGRIRGALPDQDEIWSFTELLSTGRAIVSFAEDEAGEIYVVEYGFGTAGKVHQLVAGIFADGFESGNLSAWTPLRRSSVQ